MFSFPRSLYDASISLHLSSFYLIQQSDENCQYCGNCRSSRGHNVWEITERLFMFGQGHISSLWPEATTFEKSQRGYSWLVKAVSIHCDQWHNIWKITERLFMAGQGRISSLWPEATTFEKRYRGYLWLATSVHCDQRPQHLSNHREAICGRTPSQFIMDKGHNNAPAYLNDFS